MKYIITNKQYNLLLESSEEETLLRIPDFSFFAYDWEILQAYLKSRGNPRYYIDGNLDLYNSENKFLGNLVGVEGNLDLSHSEIKSLEDLEYVGRDLYLFNSKIKSLGNLVRVNGDFNLDHSKIKSLGNLEYVGGYLSLVNTKLPKTTTEDEIRSKVNVVGEIYFT